MARKRLKWQVTGDMFGTDISLLLPDDKGPLMVGHKINYDPIKRLAKGLKSGYLFRSPKTDPNELATVWDTMAQFEYPYLIWVECEKKDEKFELTAFARISDQGEATMFAYAHSSFEKWSDAKEAEDKKERKRKPAKIRITKDGRLKGKITVETLGD